MLVDVRHSGLLVVDMQARLVPALAEPEAVAARVGVLLQAAAALEVPTLLTEQYPRGLGHTVNEVAALASHAEVLEKLHFSAAREPAFATRVKALEREMLVVCGAETHVCVLQTCADLLRLGYRVFVVADACGSRRGEDKARGLARLDRLGAQVVTSEMVVFEWLERAGTDTFREVSKLIK